VPTGSSSNLMYESSASVSSSGDEELHNTTEFHQNNNKSIKGPKHQIPESFIDSKRQNPENIANFDKIYTDLNTTKPNSNEILRNDVEISQSDSVELSERNLNNNNNNKVFAANCDDSNRSTNKTSFERNGSAVMLAKNNINTDCEELNTRLDCDNLHQNVGQVHSSKLNNSVDLNPNRSENKFVTTAVVNNTTQL
jgi:hypothetical protein